MAEKKGVSLWSTDPDKNADVDPTINWAEGQMPSSVNNSARAMMARIAEQREMDKDKVITIKDFEKGILNVDIVLPQFDDEGAVRKYHPNVLIRPVIEMERGEKIRIHLSLETVTIVLKEPRDLLTIQNIRFCSEHYVNEAGIYAIPVTIQFSEWTGTDGTNTLTMPLLWHHSIFSEYFEYDSHLLPYFGAASHITNRTFPFRLSKELREVIESGDLSAISYRGYGVVIDDRAPTIYNDYFSKGLVLKNRAFQWISKNLYSINFWGLATVADGTVTIGVGTLPVPHKGEGMLNPTTLVVSGARRGNFFWKPEMSDTGYIKSLIVHSTTIESGNVIIRPYTDALKMDGFIDIQTDEERQLLQLAYPVYGTENDRNTLRKRLLELAKGNRGDITSIVDKVFIEDKKEIAHGQ